MIRKGCIYSELQTIPGKGHSRASGNGGATLRRGVGLVRSTRRRWVAEIMYHRKRYRFRSTSLANCQAWLKAMADRFSD